MEQMIKLANFRQITGLTWDEMRMRYAELCPGWFQGEMLGEKPKYIPEPWANAILAAIQLGAVRTKAEPFKFDGAPPRGTLKLLNDTNSETKWLAVIGLGIDGAPVNTMYAV